MHEALVPGERAFDRSDVLVAVLAQVVAGRIPAQAERRAVGGEAGIGLVLARPPLHDIALGLDRLGERDVPELGHGAHVVVAIDPRAGQLALRVEVAAHRGERRMRAHHDLVFGD